MARHALGFKNNVCMTATYSKPGGIESIDSAIFRALKQTIKKLPAMSALPMDEGLPSAYYARPLEIDLKHAVVFVELKQLVDDSATNQELQDVLNVQHNLNFINDGTSPFWRLIILRHVGNSSTFMASFVFHHSLGDGMSGQAFHRSFHASLLDLDSLSLEDDTLNVFTTTSSLEMTPSLENLHPLPLSAWFLGSKLWNEVFAKQHGELWSGKSVSFAEAAQTTQVHLITVSEEIAKPLLRLSRQHSVTLTATLETLLAECIFNYLPAEYQKLTCDGTLSLRRFIPQVDDDSFGNYVSTYRHDHYRREIDSNAEESLWTEAGQVKESIAAEVSKNGTDSVVGLLRWAGSLLDFFKKKENKTRDSSFEIGNLGVFKYQRIPSLTDWSITQVIFSQSQNAFGPPLSASIASGPDGSLSICFAWLETIIESEWMQEVIHRFQQKIDELSQA